MTEYGRGPGSEPWHPEDPLYGDGGWGGRQTHVGQQSAYGGQPQQYPQQPQYGDWSQEQQAGYGGQQYPYYDGQDRPQYDQQFPGQTQQQYQQYQDGQYQGGWDATGTHGQVPYAADPGDPYGQSPTAYGGEQPDFYGTDDAYPPPMPPGRRRPEPQPGPDPDPETGWDPGEDQGEHAFFNGGEDDGDDEDEDESESRRGRGDRRGKGRKPVKSKKRRTGCACMVVVLVFGGGLGGVGYFGYKFYQNRFGPAPDYAGSGNGETVVVEIPKGAGGYVIGQKLKEAGVVESVDAFVSAQQANPDGKSLQDGVYTLQKHMSAASAVELMLSPKSRSNLIIAEGTRNVAVYAMIDKRLKVPAGTTAKVAKDGYKSLGLPAWALNHPNLHDPLEGFLFPSSYAVTKGQKPQAVLKSMVDRAKEKYAELGLEKRAQSLGLDGPWQLLTVASLVQAEGRSHEDFEKMAEVVYNRLKPGNPETYGALEFDSTYNYVKNQSKLDLTIAEVRKYNNPYNTYHDKGLPPGPIDNPGEEAIQGALNPTHDGWYYFISMDGTTTRFTKTYADHEKLVEEWTASRNKN
ncbi:endolytic transglycosylase MltG [Streptomyces sp. NK08204]|uniref:endolytic transglycosylase MltG n=1 Tax=Streptomyces sp. NK08204 TaxID=2873260 RepID=UPI001CED383D|nr:endolytic transglycosylase MltG [Streptomyces sp. NK08204]